MFWRAPTAGLAIILGLSALTVSAVIAQQPISIASVQGTGEATPLAGDTVTVQGVVTADLRGADSFDGLYLQSETSADIDGASDGVFVDLDGADPAVAIGDLVEVTGEATEHDEQTEIVASATNLVKSGVGVPAVTELTDGADRESLEGMLVAPVGGFTLTSTDGLDTEGSLQIADATGATLTIDDGYSVTPTSRPYLPSDTLYTPGSAFTAAAIPMVLGQSAEGYRLEPTVPVDGASDDDYFPSFTLNGFVLGEAPQMQAP